MKKKPAHAAPAARPPRPSKTKPATGVAPGYLHGYSSDEQDRLYKQARFLEKSVYEHIDFSQQHQVLEVGCGVGAQTEILLERFPQLFIHGLDASEAQVKRARNHLASHLSSNRLKLDVADALHLPFEEDAFDGAFVCWFLEHVQEPIEILREIRRVMKPSGTIYCNEVLNSSFYVHPYSPATLQYWFAFNDHQWNLKGDPFVGAKLANYLMAAGFQNITTKNLIHHYDNRAPKQRAQFIEYWINLLLSGAAGLIEAGKVTQEIVDEMEQELERLKDDPDAVFFYSWIQAKAQAF
ncbi:MAG: methyltransferase domain-containing protein [Methylotenera sp.]|nr:methyltransferase domain-containing protein [Oligoflexia bacterium]